MAIPTNARECIFDSVSDNQSTVYFSSTRSFRKPSVYATFFISHLNVITSLMVIEKHTENNVKYQVNKIQQRMHIKWNNCSQYFADVITCSLQKGLCVYRGYDAVPILDFWEPYAKKVSLAECSSLEQETVLHSRYMILQIFT